MNEFGVYQNSKATDAEVLDWTSYVARNCESNGIAWSWWEYNSGFGAYSYGQWRARVMNGLFPAEPAGNTYASTFNAADYAQKVTISFPGYAGASALANFPVLVKLSQSSIHRKALSRSPVPVSDDLSVLVKETWSVENPPHVAPWCVNFIGA